MKNFQKKLCFIGPLPPPVHGLSKINQSMINILSNLSDEIVVLNTSSKSLHRTPLIILFRLLKMLKTVLYLTYLLIFNKVNKLYISLSGGLGQIYDLILITLSRIFRIRIFIHHHSFAYLNTKKRTTNYILNISQKNITHIVLCERMGRLLKKYNSNISFNIVSNTAFIPNQNFVKKLKNHKKFSIGFLSNISFDKGIHDYIEVLKSFSKDLTVTGIIAGPYSDKRSEVYLERNLKSLKNIQYLGSLNEKQKKIFFKQIDILLFPTNYANEAEPLVIHEAMSHGVPVIARFGGCIIQIINQNSGVVLEIEDDFCLTSAKLLNKFLEDSKSLEKLKKQSYEAFNSNKNKSLKSLNRIISEMIS